MRRQLLADLEFISSAYAGLFIGATFGWPIFTANTLPGGGPAYPFAALGVRVQARPAEAWTVLAGSLPPGAPATFYADLVPRLRAGSRVAIDTSDAPLAALVERLPEDAPDLLKPNAEELASVTGTDAAALEADPGAAAKAARTLVDGGVGAVLATLGGRGAVLVDRDGAWFAPAPPTTVVSTVGAGDCTLFGYLLAELRGLPAPDRLALAVAYGSAAAGLPGTTIPTPTHVRPELVEVRELVLHTENRG